MKVIRKQTKKWKTKDGSKIRVCDMTDTHLLNTIKMLNRFAYAAYHSAHMGLCDMYGLVRGEMAAAQLENALEEFEEDSEPSDYMPSIYWAMKADALRRGLDLGKVIL